MSLKINLLIGALLINYFHHIESIKSFATSDTDIFRQNQKLKFGIELHQRRKPRNAFHYKVSNKTNSSKIPVAQSESKFEKINHKEIVLTRPKIHFSQNLKIPFRAENFRCTNSSSIECLIKTEKYREKIINEMNRAMDENHDEQNFYLVDYLNKTDDATRHNGLCTLLNADVRVLESQDVSDYQLKNIMPKSKLLKSKTEKKPSCVVVSSAGSMNGANLGELIDKHDVVLRFNNAPTLGFEADVGKKTTMRIVNSQVASKSEFNFTTSSIYKNITIGIWDPSKFNSSIDDWISNPDFNFITNYKQFLKNDPNAQIYLIDPRSIWRLWKILQHDTKNGITKNPPSSGFIGIVLLLNKCDYIDIIEYIPSTRFNGKCHYYAKETNAACTFGSWHPLAAEKLFTLKLNSLDDFTVFQEGIMRLNANNVRCE